ncbi:MAG TPA: hypothetical protein VHB25_10905 [Gemmatimonadaceae bacterium]|nr:hypothetical protein [Gemmatimonadaceae bacterium]
MHPHRLGWISTVAAAALFTAGCAQDVVAPRRTAQAPARDVVGGTPHGIPNSLKYADNGIKPATGRSGSASLEARALLAKDGSTQVEATTGDLETGASVGTITKTQVKFLIGHGFTRNANNLNAGGYWTNTFAGLARGTGVEVQANVGDIDGKRTDVVTVATQVAARPDIDVRSVNAPATAITHTPVNIVAVLSETNGDVGARADCVLSVDGTQVAQAKGIWVDAGGTVSCAFTHTFDAAGTYTIGATAANVNPGDWDTSNNSSSASITVADPGQPIQHGSMYAESLLEDYSAHTYVQGLSPYDNEYSSHTEFGNVSATGVDYLTTLPPTGFASAAVTLSVNGSQAYDGTLTPLSETTSDDGDFVVTCRSYQSGQNSTVQIGNTTLLTFVSDGNSADVCSGGRRSTNEFFNNYFFARVAGSAVYSSSTMECYTGCDTYIVVSQSTTGGDTSPAWSLGDDIHLRVVFTDVAGVGHVLDKSVVLNQDLSKDVNLTFPLTCYFDGYRGGQSCYQTQATGYEYAGTVDW